MCGIALQMRAEAATREPAMQALCCDALFDWQRRTRGLAVRSPADGARHPQFVLLDGPPFANGPLHVGHFLNKVLKDMINRYKLLQGFGVPFTPGWDCHGLPIEQKALDLTPPAHRAALTPIEIRARCERLAASAIAVQRATFRRWGVLGDWAGAYRTMDRGYEAAQLGAR